METQIMSFLTPLADTAHPGGNAGKVFIIVPQHRAYFADLLIKAFEGREDVEVITDRRHGERRTQQQASRMERRQGQRRRPKEGVIEVVVGTIGPQEPRAGSA